MLKREQKIGSNVCTGDLTCRKSLIKWNFKEQRNSWRNTTKTLKKNIKDFKIQIHRTKGLMLLENRRSS
jgi:hypothetical protein